MNRLRLDDDDVRFVRRVVIVIVIAAVTCAFYLAGDLLILAFGWNPAIAAYSVFLGGLLAGAAGAISQLVYYRRG